MKRFVVSDIAGDGTFDNAFKPVLQAEASGYSVLSIINGRAVVQIDVPDGTPQTTATLIDVDTATGLPEDVVLSPAIKNRIKTWLTAKGFANQVTLIDMLGTTPGQEADAIVNKRKLLYFIAHHVFNEPVLVERLRIELNIS